MVLVSEIGAMMRAAETVIDRVLVPYPHKGFFRSFFYSGTLLGSRVKN
jgi:hypothetical protein